MPVTPPLNQISANHIAIYVNDCVDLRDAGGEVDYSVCEGYGDSTSCENAGCYWYTQGQPPPGVCTVDICLADSDFNGRITGADLSVLKKELARTDCPCAP